MTALAHDHVPQTAEEMAACLADPMWRICSGQLYRIMVKSADGNGSTSVPFRPNRAQRRFIERLWTRNIILKARQLGFTTLVAILWLDHALFVDDQRCVIVAQDLPKAEEIFRDKVKYAYDRLPPAIRNTRPLLTDSKSELLFSNNSSIKVTTSARGGTTHRLHISEYGKICAKFPDKAQEIITGSFPSVPLDGITIVESTAEGQEGDFFDMTEQAMAIEEMGKPLTQRDYRFHFYPWWQEPTYVLDQQQADQVTLTAEDIKYFDDIEVVMQTTLSRGQRAWYVATRVSEFRGSAQKMWQEYPSTPREAFQQTTEGYYFAVQLAQARKAGRITKVPFVPGVPVNTFWDIGGGDGTAIWLHQRVGLIDRFFEFVEDWEKPYRHYVTELQRIAAEQGGIVWGIHYLPHDAEHRRPGTDNLDSPLDMLQAMNLGGKWDTVPRVQDLTHGIQMARDAFANAYFDEAACAKGIAHLQGYRKKWNRSAGRWSDEPNKADGHSEAADAFRQFAQGYDAPLAIEKEQRRRNRDRNWKTR